MKTDNAILTVLLVQAAATLSILKRLADPSLFDNEANKNLLVTQLEQSQKVLDSVTRNLQNGQYFI